MDRSVAPESRAPRKAAAGSAAPQAPPFNRNSAVAKRGGDRVPEQPLCRHPNRPAPAANAEVLGVLLEGIQEGVAHVSTEGLILYANTRFARLLGADPAEIEGNKTSLRDLMTPESAAELDRALKCASQEPIEGSIRIENARHARARSVRLALTPVHWKSKTTIKVTASEVTELLEKNRELKAKEESLHALSARIMELQEEERRRIARDLHDITGQELAVVIMQLMQVARAQRADSESLKGITDAATMIRKIEDEIRTLSYVLHPPLIDELGLSAALNWYVEGFTKRSGIEIKLEIQEGLPRLARDKDLALFRVVQEALTNVMRHSGSRTAQIRVAYGPETVTLSIRDEGRGIGRGRLSKSDRQLQGVGIAGMRERLQQLGGSLEVRSLSKGTDVVAVMPIGEAPAIEPPFTEASLLEAAKALGYKAGANQSAGDTTAPPALAQPSGPHAAAGATKKRVLIADDHEVTRQGVRALLKDELAVEICGEAKDTAEVIDKARELAPDLIIMDLSMPGAGGFAAARTIRQSRLHARILFFTTHQSPEIERMVRLAGFEGLVEKADVARDLTRGVRAALEGKLFFGGQVVDRPEEPGGAAGKRAAHA